MARTDGILRGCAKRSGSHQGALAGQSQNRLARLQFDLAVARVLLTSDQPELSRAQLEKILKEARTYQFAGVEFEARLALAELEKKSDTFQPREPSWLLSRAARAAKVSA